MKTFRTTPGVQRFETGGPEGLLAVEAGKPLSTDDPRVAAVLETAGAHALTSSDATPGAETKADKAHKGGEL
jgi:hypothetical protein